MDWYVDLLYNISRRRGILIVQDFLREHGLDALVERTKCKAIRDEDYNNLVLLKYSIIESPIEDPLVQHCRGIVLDEDDDWKIISWGLNKFFNHSEQLAAPIDWDTAQVLEKLDGTYVNLFYYDYEWLVSTTGRPGASGEVPYAKHKNFEQLFWEVFNELKLNLPTDTDKSYIFELMTMENRVIIPHKENRLVLTGVRDLPSGKELMPEDFSGALRCKHVQTYKINSLEESLHMASQLNGIRHEGFVVRDANFNRIKIKSKSYVGLHHLKSSLESSPRKLIEIIQTNEGEEFLNYFPEFEKSYNSIKKRYFNIQTKIKEEYSKHIDIKKQKDFAISINDSKYKTPMFSVRNGRSESIEHWMRELDSKKMERLLGEFDE